eukprot:CAMPEP_0115348524 /NCGR_PEP_ID=MMETSP0270-20121206/95450_1 /TAXON_ID=71861 /ORGANISM="Scrippsiella trochoidea, Strain CCMP3099" /LENGTH=266 /DNA_ID=CAMNT_0002770499 /DNA_START=321 /DNA_END=1122 /DNA_ORIENTATION=-
MIICFTATLTFDDDEDEDWRPEIGRSSGLRASGLSWLMSPLHAASMAMAQGFASRQPTTSTTHGLTSPRGCAKSHLVNCAVDSNCWMSNFSDEAVPDAFELACLASDASLAPNEGGAPAVVRRDDLLWCGVRELQRRNQPPTEASPQGGGSLSGSATSHLRRLPAKEGLRRGRPLTEDSNTVALGCVDLAWCRDCIVERPTASMHRSLKRIVLSSHIDPVFQDAFESVLLDPAECSEPSLSSSPSSMLDQRMAGLLNWCLHCNPIC